MQNILNIKSVPVTDDSISSIQYHVYNPYTTSYKNSDEIRIAIQQQDLYVLPHESFLYIEGVVKKTSTATTTTTTTVINSNFVNNAAAHLFEEMRYELNNFEIDRCKSVGITTTMKGYVSFTPRDMTHTEIASWNINSNAKATVDGTFSYCIPLKAIFGFVEDYRNVIINAKHELILVRSRSDVNLFCSDVDNIKFELNKIQWRMPHVQVSDTEKLKLLKCVDQKQPIPLNFRSWELYEYPTLPQTDRHIWAVKTSTQLQKPRYIVVGFQTDRNNKIAKNISHFDNCELTDLKVSLNSECYPYENLNINFDKNQYAILYDMYCKFQESYYCHDKALCQPLLNFQQFKSIAPLVVIDCSRQNEVIKNGVVDIRIAMQLNKNFAPNTTAYCLIIHDNMITYNPYTNIVNRSV